MRLLFVIIVLCITYYKVCSSTNVTILDSIAFFPSRCCFGLSVCLSFFISFFSRAKSFFLIFFHSSSQKKKEEKKKQKIADEV